MTYDPVTLILIMLAMSLIPFAAVMATSYVKLVVVLSLVRNAIGVQTTPPNIVINGLALIISAFIMTPVLQDSAARVSLVELRSAETLEQVAEKAAEAIAPFKQFMGKHADSRAKVFFVSAARSLWGAERAEGLGQDSLIVVVPAFVATELTEAFQAAFLIYIPFVVVDLVVSTILMAMGMMMVSPMTISLPFKLMLFVLLNGWNRIIENLILSYR